MASQARTTRLGFQRYVSLEHQDARFVATVNLEADVSFGPHDVGVRVDVVLFEDDGFAGRVLLWDVSPCDMRLAEMYSAPCVRLIEEGLGLNCHAIDVWQLRHQSEFRVSRQAAMRRLPEVRSTLDLALR
jgi:hypothetical protein